MAIIKGKEIKTFMINSTRRKLRCDCPTLKNRAWLNDKAKYGDRVQCVGLGECARCNYCPWVILKPNETW